MRPTDADLVRACLAGEEVAWRTLVLRHERLIYSIPLRYGMSETEADDVFQNVCLTLLEHLGSLRDPERIGSWLVKTTRRACWARWRARAHDEPLSDNLRGDDEADPEVLVSLFEETQGVLAALNQLPDRCQRLLQRLYLDAEPATYIQLAEELGMPVNSLGPTRARCIERLVGLLESVTSADVLSRRRETLI